ncbi:LCP family protein [Microbacterium gorillae]|uniref:LCP family protein n=1 Tax=Microbacterium gorillae TaxID=1231063 RepID=UPI00058BF23E|nr:LCP family protein [Microbacterium gorillae]
MGKAGHDSRRTLARHARLTSQRPIAQLLKVLSIAVASVLVATLGVVGFVVYELTSTYTANAVTLGGEDELPPDIGQLQGGANILIAGTDVCEPQYAKYFADRCVPGLAEDGARSDVNLLVHISAAPRRITVVSFPRDLMVPIPECTASDGSSVAATDRAMLNSAFNSGGLACTVATIEHLAGIDIQYAASINWGGVIEMTDAIGGVEVCLANGIDDPDTGIDWPAGNRTIKGLDALQFLRTRHGVGNGGDLGRISNQQQYMSRLAKKLMSSEVLSNPVTLLKLANVALSAIDPSKSMTNPYTLVQMAMAAKDVKFSDIVFVQYPVVDDPYDPNRVDPDYDSAKVLFDALAANKSLQLTGDAGSGVVTEGGTGSGTVAPATSDGGTAEESTPTPTPTPTSPDSVALPSTVTGTTAAESTCSNGNVR